MGMITLPINHHFRKSQILDICASHLSVPQSIILLQMLLEMQPSSMIVELNVKKMTASILNTLTSDTHPFNCIYFEMVDKLVKLESYPSQAKVSVQMEGREIKVG